MAKLRKMLGSIEDPHVIALMRGIETQSKLTLTKWAVSYAEAHFLEIYEKTYPNDLRLRGTIAALKEYISGTRKLNEVKPFLKESKQAAKEAEENPTAQAAARAISVACAVVQTPTNALGFTFYGVAAVIYDRVGLSETAECYDALASEEFEKILSSLREAAVADEQNPVKISWNC